MHEVENGNKVDLSGPKFEMTSTEKLSMLLRFCQHKKGRIYYTQKMRMTTTSIYEIKSPCHSRRYGVEIVHNSSYSFL